MKSVWQILIVMDKASVRNAKSLHLRHRSIFAYGSEISPEARMRMAAAVQSFISGDVGLISTLPAIQSIERGRDLTLAAWRAGLKSLTIVFDPAYASRPPRQSIGRRIKVSSQAHVKPPIIARRNSVTRHTAVIPTKKILSTRRGVR